MDTTIERKKKNTSISPQSKAIKEHKNLVMTGKSLKNSSKEKLLQGNLPTRNFYFFGELPTRNFFFGELPTKIFFFG